MYSSHCAQVLVLVLFYMQTLAYKSGPHIITTQTELCSNLTGVCVKIESHVQSEHCTVSNNNFLCHIKFKLENIVQESGTNPT